MMRSPKPPRSSRPRSSSRMSGSRKRWMRVKPKLGAPANPFATPNEILPEWYFFPTFNLLRILPNKFVGVLSMLYLPGVLLVLPFGENLNRYSNPFRRPLAQSIFLVVFVASVWLSIGALLPLAEG